MKKNNQLTKKEIDHYIGLWGHIMTKEEIISWGRKRLEDFEDEWFGRAGNGMPADSKDCPGCWNLKEGCTCNGAPRIKTSMQEDVEGLMVRTSDHNFSIYKYINGKNLKKLI